MFSQATITEVFPPSVFAGTVLLRWSSSSPAGTTFQVYLDRSLSWWGRATSCLLPAPAARVRIDVGTVGPGEASTDFSALLDAASPKDHATLAWTGGTFLGVDISTFRVYSSAAPYGDVDDSNVLAEIPAYVAGQITDGYGWGGYGEGGYGASAATYSWRSGPLRPGDWLFQVRSVDTSGNESLAAASAVTIIGPPGPPARDDSGLRLELAYNPSTHAAALTWLPPEY